MSENKFPFGTYKENMDRFLEQFKEGEVFYVRFEPADYSMSCTKANFYEHLNEHMPQWFLSSCINFKESDTCVYEPVFCPIQQAAWDAAMKEYFRLKGEWCAKHGCE